MKPSNRTLPPLREAPDEVSRKPGDADLFGDGLPKEQELDGDEGGGGAYGHPRPPAGDDDL